MPDGPGIQAMGFLDDLRSGMTDTDLMKKYKLTARGLGSVFRHLIDEKSVRLAEIVRRFRHRSDLPELIAEFRTRPRIEPSVALPIFESTRPENRGVISDLTEQGMGVRGLEAQVDDIKTLVVPVQEFFDISPILLQVICTWRGDDEAEPAVTAGFRVVDVLKGSLMELCRLVRAVSSK